MGTVMYAVLITLGEMISFLPIPGGFFSLATRFLSPAIVPPHSVGDLISGICLRLVVLVCIRSRLSSETSCLSKHNDILAPQ